MHSFPIMFLLLAYIHVHITHTCTSHTCAHPHMCISHTRAYHTYVHIHTHAYHTCAYHTHIHITHIITYACTMFTLHKVVHLLIDTLCWPVNGHIHHSSSQLCSVQKQVFSAPFPLGHCESVLLSHASNSVSSHSLRAASLSALSAMTGLDTVSLLHASETLQATPSDSTHFSSSLENFIRCMEQKVGVARPWVAGVMASFLPGLCSTITRLISTDANTISLVVCQGLITWAQWVGVVMSGDASLPASSTPPSHPPTEHKSLLVERNEKWRCDTAVQLQVLVQRMHVLVTSEAWKMRLFLAGWAHSLLTHCHR